MIQDWSGFLLYFYTIHYRQNFWINPIFLIFMVRISSGDFNLKSNLNHNTRDQAFPDHFTDFSSFFDTTDHIFHGS